MNSLRLPALAFAVFFTTLAMPRVALANDAGDDASVVDVDASTGTDSDASMDSGSESPTDDAGRAAGSGTSGGVSPVASCSADDCNGEAPETGCAIAAPHRATEGGSLALAGMLVAFAFVARRRD